MLGVVSVCANDAVVFYDPLTIIESVVSCGKLFGNRNAVLLWCCNLSLQMFRCA